MMKYRLLFVVSALLLAGCKDYKPEMERAVMERDSIQMLGMAKDSSINAFIETLNEIEGNLDSITQSQQAIATASGDQVEFSKDIRERIHQNIDIISELMNKNKEMLDNLNQKLKNSNYNIASLKKMIEKLTADIALKEQEIAMMAEQIGGLKIEIDGLNRSVDSLRVVNTQKENVIDDKINQLNTAYWTIGTYKQLKETNILNKQGGFLGMGKAKVIRKDFNQDAFNKVDITKTSTIDINHKSPKLITTHPTDSYKLNKNEKGVVTTLEITDPIRFWKASKYLVIVTG
jgi:DNA repair exonuclease SbcCD ATPase subunit